VGLVGGGEDYLEISMYLSWISEISLQSSLYDTEGVCIRMIIRKIIKKIFVGTLKMIMKVFLRRKIFGEILVEYLDNISGKNLRGSIEEIFVGYFK
jgi:hypothetical protein